MFAFLLPLAGMGQGGGTLVAKQAWVDSVFAKYTELFVYNAAETLPVFGAALSILQEQRDTCRMAKVQAWRSHCFEELGQLDSAVFAAQQGIIWFRPACDSLYLMSLNVYLSNALLTMGDAQKVLAISTNSLALWNEAWPYSVARNGLFTNRAIAIATLGDLPGALEAFKDVARNAINEGRKDHEVGAYGNLGAVFGMMSEQGRIPAFLDSSELYQRRALEVYRATNNEVGMQRQYGNLAAMAADRGRPGRALQYLDSAWALASENGILESQVSIEDLRRRNFFALGKIDSAYHHLDIYLILKDSLLNTEKVKAIADVQEKYESEKKARTIKELEVDKLASDLRQATLTRTRNIYLFSGIGVLLVAGGLWSRLRFVHKSRAAISREKEISEGLLHNILPEEVAAELKQKGYADTQEFETATILFTDFKGFTQLSEKLSPDELVKELNICFKAFDGIMDTYDIEKIKTIGDAYMAAGGLPDKTKGSPKNVVMAALDMQAFMHDYAAEREAKGLPHFTMRVGLHTGPVIAGIVGVKKFAYDIWGDTVNTASRMESSGEVGRVNISESTYAIVKDHPEFAFKPRGKVAAKGKGEMEMFFVEKA